MIVVNPHQDDGTYVVLEDKHEVAVVVPQEDADRITRYCLETSLSFTVTPAGTGDAWRCIVVTADDGEDAVQFAALILALNALAAPWTSNSTQEAISDTVDQALRSFGDR